MIETKTASTPSVSDVRMGALFGALFSLPLMVLYFLGERIAGLPFPPFDIFDVVTRLLPGDVLTFGIDAMVEVLLALGWGATLDTTAKTVEQVMALALFVLFGAMVGWLIFAVAGRGGRVASLALGAVSGLLAYGMGQALGVTLADFTGLVWLVLLGAGWAWALLWAYDTLGAVTSPDADGVVLMNRRQFLVRVGGTTAFFTVIGTGLGTMLSPTVASFRPREGTASPSEPDAFVDGSGQPLPNWDDPVLPAPGTRAEYTPLDEHYRIDIVIGRLPEIDEATYTLPITGLVAREVSWTLDEIRAMPGEDAFITMACISNRIGGSLIGTTKWTGVPMQYILQQIQPDEDAVALRIRGADGFDEYLSLDLIRQDARVMLAYAFDDQPLPVANGFPLRVHIPDRYGMKQPKWITSIEVVDELGEGYWVRRGWSREALVRATSVIDTVAVDDLITDADGVLRVPIGGIAWAGARGISKVEVSVDDGDWIEAQLRSPMSERTWVIWRYDWAFTEGQHRFAVRCYEADGTMQTLLDAPVRPDGATGIHSVNATIRTPDTDV